MPAQSQSMRLAIVGLTHDHVHGILRQLDRRDLEVVGIAESNQELVARHQARYGFDSKLVFSSIEKMLAATEPEAVLGFGSTYQHLEIVQACAPRGIHVMVEKPLAVNMAHAREMQQLAEENDIHVLVNYETTWYPSNHKAYALAQNGSVGPLRKIVVHDGHEGPREIGCSEEFLTWLTDPVLNGGGALTDFGCYGANLMTFLMDGERPLSVSAITQTNKPDIYPEVDDEATILLQYAQAQGIIQASWNWPFSRKDMEVYGSTGLIMVDNSKETRIRLSGDYDMAPHTLPELDRPLNEPFGYFLAVIRGEVKMKRYDLSTLANNLIVTEILDAARESAETGQRVRLKK